MEFYSFSVVFLFITVMKGTRDVTPTVLKSSTGLEGACTVKFILLFAFDNWLLGLPCVLARV